MDASPSLADLNERSREIFRHLVETYLETGEPVGSRTLSKQMSSQLSAASIRNVMQDLEQIGLLDSPHVSAGRRPTHQGLRLFVDGLLEVGGPSPDEKRTIEDGLGSEAGEVESLLDKAGAMLSGLAGAASLIVAPKDDSPVKHIDFVPLSEQQTLVVLVKEDGSVENRLFASPSGLTPSDLREASNYLNAQLRGRTLAQAGLLLAREIEARRREISALADTLVEDGVARWSAESGEVPSPDRLMVRGRAQLLSDNELMGDLDRMQSLLNDLERTKNLAQLVDLADDAAGVRVFIGAENKLYSLAGSSLVISPYMSGEQTTIGAIGVIGPTRMNYGRIMPIVDYTAQLMGRLMADRAASSARGGGGLE